MKNISERPIKRPVAVRLADSIAFWAVHGSYGRTLFASDIARYATALGVALRARGLCVTDTAIERDLRRTDFSRIDLTEPVGPDDLALLVGPDGLRGLTGKDRTAARFVFIAERGYRTGDDVPDIRDNTTLRRVDPVPLLHGRRTVMAQYRAARVTEVLRLILAPASLMLSAIALLFVVGTRLAGQMDAAAAIWALGAVMVATMAYLSIAMIRIQVLGDRGLLDRACKRDHHDTPSGCENLMFSAKSRIFGVALSEIALWGSAIALGALLCLPGTSPFPVLILIPMALGSVLYVLMQVAHGVYCKICNSFHAVTTGAVGVLAFHAMFWGVTFDVSQIPVLVAVGLAVSAIVPCMLVGARRQTVLRKRQDFLIATADRDAVMRRMLTGSTPWPLSAADIDIAIPSRAGADAVMMTLVLSPDCYTCLQIIRSLAAGGLARILDHVAINIIIADHDTADKAGTLRALIRHIAIHQGNTPAMQLLFSVGDIPANAPDRLNRLIARQRNMLGAAGVGTSVIPPLPDVPWTPYLFLDGHAPAEAQQDQLLDFLDHAQSWPCGT